MGIGDHQPGPGQAAAGQGAEEVEPEGLRLGGTDCHAQHLAAAIGVHAHRDGDGDRDDPARLPDLHVGGVQPQVGPVALNGAAQEVVHPLIDLGTESGDLALGSMPSSPMARTKSSTERVEMPWT